MGRLRELDFLRGLAIILVLLRHSNLFTYTSTMGWIGVDLFFVLSGFLVSGLLFQEYIKYGDIKPWRFLIRRGFKIYPIYFLTYPIYLFLNKASHSFNGILSDLTFTQNYICGYGYSYPASWSLAVEEHFYLCLTILIWLGIKYNKANFQYKNNFVIGSSQFQIIVFFFIILSIALRLFSNIYFPYQFIKNFTMTHLRIDSLLTGVLISFLYHFKLDYLKKFFYAKKIFLIIICILGLSWTPFIEPTHSFFVKTLGFTFLYISFGIILVFFLLTKNINQKLNNVFSEKVVNIISEIGLCSYSIYIIHTAVNWVNAGSIRHYRLYNNHYINFLLTTTISVLIGMLMTYYIEKKFLSLRNKLYPSRSKFNIITDQIATNKLN
jgi:peptidoglycan/LPS O-acetylase OafA/YrhL